MKKIILVLLSVTLFTNIGFCDKPFFDALAKYDRYKILLKKDGTISDIILYNKLKSFGQRFRPVQKSSVMVDYWKGFIELCQEKGYYTTIFNHVYHDYPDYHPFNTAVTGKQEQIGGGKSAWVRDMNKVFKKLNPGVSDRFDEFNIHYSIDNCNNSKKNPTYKEYGDKSTDGTGEETDTFYCTFLN